LDDLLATTAFPKSVTVIEAVGPPFQLTGVTTKNGGTTTTTTQDITALGAALQLNDGQYHVGNTKDPNMGQLYRVYPSQVVFCTANLPAVYTDLKAAVAQLPGPDAVKVMAKKGSPRLGFEIKGMFSAASRGSSGGSSSSTAGSGTAAAPGGGGGATGAAPTVQISQAMNVNRLTAIATMANCNVDEIPISQQDEVTFANGTASFIRIEWRSPSDVVDYLGALLRNAAANSSAPIDFAATTQPQTQYAMSIPYQNLPSTYFVGKDAAMALHVATELVNMSKLASGTQISQPILFYPVAQGLLDAVTAVPLWRKSASISSSGPMRPAVLRM
jgi:hypothetical protein